MIKDVHAPGHYAKYPEVTWDLAQERWEMSRSYLYYARCQSCGWTEHDVSLERPERIAVTEVIVVARHWYECPSDHRVSVTWHCGMCLAPIRPQASCRHR